MSRKFRHIATAAATAGVLACGGGVAQAASCANGDLVPAAGNVELVRGAVLCELNAQRAQRGLTAWRTSSMLQRSATAHSADMISRRYFSHTSKNGRELADRVKTTGYLRGRWALGENLAWGTGELSTAAGVVRSWMQSPSHRSVVLSSRYKDAGIGIVLGNPEGHQGGATMTLNAGRRGTAKTARRSRR